MVNNPEVLRRATRAIPPDDRRYVFSNRPDFPVGAMFTATAGAIPEGTIDVYWMTRTRAWMSSGS